MSIETGDRTHIGQVKVSANGGDDLVVFGKSTVNNTEIPTPANVAYWQRHRAPPFDESSENAAIYCRIDHRPGEDDFRYWLYGEITEQSLVGGSMTKVIHRGKGDAHYVALMGDNLSGFGYESAMFGGWQDAPTDTIPKQENGYIATFQGAGGFQESVKNQANSIGFQTLVHDDGVDPTTPDSWVTNYGLFYANNSIANAFVVRRSQYAPSGYSQYKLMDDAQRPIWQIMDDGASQLLGEEATAGSPNRPSPASLLRGYYWTGSAEQANQTQMVHATAGIGGGVFQISVGNPGAETLSLQVKESGDLELAGLLQFGGASSSYPAIRRAGSELYARLADDSSYANFRANSFFSQAHLEAAAGGQIRWNNRTECSAPVDGDLRVTNAAGNDFGILQFGGTTSSYPGWKREGAIISARLADDSQYAEIKGYELTLTRQNVNTFWCAGGVNAGATYPVRWTGRTEVRSPADGDLLLQNAAETGFNLLQFGGTGTSHPALKRNGTDIEVKLANDSGFSHLTVGTLRLNTSSPPASSSALGIAGDVAWNSTYLYLCVATNQWKRIPLQTF